MKTLQESIIGRRSSDRTININDIKTGDIIKFRSGLLAMAYINEDNYYSGFYYNFTSPKMKNTTNLIMSSMFSKDLKHKIVDYLDIIDVYRDPNNIIGSDKNFKGFKVGRDYSALEKSNLQRLIDNGDYVIIYEEK